jgi:hypothetical protein
MNDDLIALRLLQGHRWIDRWADVEGWTPEDRDDHHAALDAVAPSMLDATVEVYRCGLFDALVRHGLLPECKRSHHGQPAEAMARTEHVRRPRGLAKHLKAAAPGQQSDLFGKGK